MASLKRRLELVRGLLDGEAAYTGPHWVVLDLTRRCNTVCLGCFFHCIQPRQPSPGDHQVQDLSPELVRKMCAELPELGTREIVFAGEGETFLHPQVFDFVGAFKRAGFQVQAFTNGTLTDPTVAFRIVESKLDVLHVTLWATNPTEHAEWHPGINPTFFHKRIEGLKLVTQAKRQLGTRVPVLNLQVPLHRSNFRNINERVELALAGGCDEVTFGYFRDWGGEFEHLGLLPEDTEAILPGLMAVKRILEAHGVRHNVGEYLDRVRLGPEVWRRLPCYAGWYTCCVKADGTVLACSHCRLAMGNLNQRSFARIWDGPEYREFRRRSSNPDTLAGLGQVCNCANCCNTRESLRVHRLFRWLAPLVPRTRNPEGRYEPAK